MTRRARNWFIIVGLSVSMWVGIIQGATMAYYAFHNVDTTTTASID